jgi:hypothetical protein
LNDGLQRSVAHTTPSLILSLSVVATQSTP